MPLNFSLLAAEKGEKNIKQNRSYILYTLFHNDYISQKLADTQNKDLISEEIKNNKLCVRRDNNVNNIYVYTR